MNLPCDLDIYTPSLPPQSSRDLGSAELTLTAIRHTIGEKALIPKRTMRRKIHNLLHALLSLFPKSSLLRVHDHATSDLAPSLRPVQHTT
jgi:hypothetical protein